MNQDPSTPSAAMTTPSYRVTNVRTSDVSDATSGIISVEVEGQRTLGTSEKLYRDDLTFYFWYRIGTRSQLWLKNAYDFVLREDLKPREVERRGLGIATAAAKTAFDELRRAVARPEPSDFDKRRAARRAEARASKEIADAAHDFLCQIARNADSCSVSLMRGYIAHSAGLGSYELLSKQDQSDVIRSVLEGLVKEGRAERCYGSGERGRECLNYFAKVTAR